MEDEGVTPALAGTFPVRLADGTTVTCSTLWSLYQTHLADYDMDTVCDITGAPRNLVERLAPDIATMKPLAIHQGEGINHWFHATEMNRASYLPLMLTGNIGKPGAGGHTWAGNYKAALFQGSPWTGPGFKGWVAEDPFQLNLDAAASGKDVVAHGYTKDEEPAYWNHGDKALIVETPRYGRRNFTGTSHMPTPPMEYSDRGFPETPGLESGARGVPESCSNPFLQIWRGGIKPVFDSKDDLAILTGIGSAMADETGDERFRDMFRFEHEGKRGVYIQRLLETSTTTTGYKLEDIMVGSRRSPPRRRAAVPPP